MNKIDKRAVIEENVTLGDNVEISPYAIIKSGAVIGDNCSIGSGVIIGNNTIMGKNNKFFSYSAIGEIPQDLKYHGEKATLEIGDNNTFREFVTINIGTENGGGVTKIGNSNLFMAYTHVAHDCIIGNSNIFSNLASLSGHIIVGNNVGVGGMSGIHQFVNLGDYSFIGGGSMVTLDVAPYSLVAGNRATLSSANLIGLKRKGFTPEQIDRIKSVFRIFFRSKLTKEEAIAKIEKEVELTEEVTFFLDFVKHSSERGICR